MKRLLTILLLLPLVCLAQTTTFNFTPIPLTTDFIRPDASATLWNEQDAFTGTMHIPGEPAQPMQDAYHRFGMTQFFGNASASDSTIIFDDLDEFFNMAIDHKMGVRFRVMGLCNNCGNPAIGDNFNNQIKYPGDCSTCYQVIPQFLHNLQQADANPDNRDWFSTRGDQDAWVPNPNSQQYQRWVRKLSLAIKNHINSTSHNGVNYGNVLKIYDIGYNGCYSEQHYNCLCDNISEIPSGARHNPNDAGVIELIDAQTDAFGGDPRWKIVIPFNAFDAVWLPHTYNTVNYGNYILNHPDSIGWINDHIGANEGYDHSYLEDNDRIDNAKLMNRWKYSPTGGEPVEWGEPADRSAVPAYVQTYHMSFFGNGNLNGFYTNNNTTEANNFRLASRRAGYRLRLTGGNCTVNTLIAIRLDWINEGGAPPYWDWDVKYLIKNGAGTTVATLNNNFEPRYFQPSTVSVSNSQNFTIPAIAAGQYGLYVRVVDPLGYRDPMPLAITPRQSDGSYFLGNITIPTGGTNQPPVANAGPNQSITGTSVSLNGSSSTDADGTIVTYAWTVTGPNTPTIASPSSANTNVTGLVVGTYTFTLTVTDDDGAISSDQVQVTVNTNQAPVADAGDDVVLTIPGPNFTQLNGTGSTDDVGIVSYQWTKISGPITYSLFGDQNVLCNAESLQIGVYVFRLTVTDASGLTDFDDVQVTVLGPNSPPIANAGPNQTITLPTTSVTLDGSASFDNVGITAYLWTQVGGATATIVSPTSVSTSVTGLTTGVYVFRLRVEDVEGLFSIDDVQITVLAAPNGAPIANAGSNQTITLPTSSVTVNSSGSTDDIAIVSRVWTKVSGPSSFTIVSPTSTSTSITGLVEGVYVFRITVTDGSGLTDSDEVTITVLPEPNDPPIANAGPNQVITLPTSSTSVDGSASTDDVGIVTYLWTKVSGPAGGTISTPGSVTTDITTLQQGTYVFRLTVTDGGGLTDFDDVSITVNPVANDAPVAIITTSTPTIQLPTNTVLLDGTSSTDDVAVTAYLWTQVSGPSQATIATPTGSTTNMNNLVEGVYFFQLQVSDAGGLTDTDIIMITVNAAVVVPPILDGRFLMRGLKFLPRIP